MKQITPFGAIPLIAAQIVGMAFNPQQSAALTTQEIVASAKPAVVYIKVYDSNQQELGQATGFFIAENRIATNYHVIEHAGYLGIYDLSGREFQFSKVVADDPNTDLAIVEITSTGYHCYLVFSGAAIQDGQPVTVIGNPKGLAGTVSSGIVSAADRGPATFQVTAPISPGSSGSPVLNEDGCVIGMIKSLAPDGQNLNFAVRGNLVVDANRYPQIAPEILPRSSDQANAQAEVDEVRNVIYNYMVATQNGQPISLASYCTATLRDWYGQKQITIAQAEESIAAYYRDWPIQGTSGDIKDLRYKSYVNQNGYTEYIVWLPFKWTAKNGKTVRSGQSTLEAIVSRTRQGHMRIVSVHNIKASNNKVANN